MRILCIVNSDIKSKNRFIKKSLLLKYTWFQVFFFMDLNQLTTSANKHQGSSQEVKEKIQNVNMAKPTVK